MRTPRGFSDSGCETSNPALPGRSPPSAPPVAVMEEARPHETLAQENWTGPNQLKKQGCKLILTWEVVRNLQRNFQAVKTVQYAFT